MGSLSGKVIAVTGAGRGIGLGYAQYFVTEGARVIVNDLGVTDDGIPVAEAAAAALRAAGGSAAAHSDDISTFEGGQSLVDRALEEFGQLDALVCNAGILRDRMLVNMDPAEWDAVLRVHLTGHFAPLQAAARHWRGRAKSTGKPAGGRVVLTSSEAGLYGNLGQVNYSAAKAGIAALGMTAARELGQYGIEINTLCPRARTSMTADLGIFDETPGFDVWAPENIAPWVAFLCSDSAAGITGQTFVAWGGTVTLMDHWSEAATIEAPERWTADTLARRVDELFADRSRALGPFPGPKAAE
jgi:NAD(P)-dependent dehydrogenase (short-subunit alcohol dehydrogenase family)